MSDAANTTKRSREQSTTPEKQTEKKKSREEKMEPNMSMNDKVDKLLGLIERMEKLEEICRNTNLTLKQEIAGIKASQIEINGNINELNQINLATTFTVTGIPIVPNKAPLDHINLILSKMEMNSMTENDFKFLKLINHKDGKTAHLFGRFWFENQKFGIFGRFKALLKEGKPLMSNEIYKLSQDSPLNGKQVRFGNVLTKTNVDLLKLARTFKENTFKYVWESEGHIFVRKNDGEKALAVKTMAQLQEIVATLQRS